jgi:hypothetical protein
LTITFKSSLQGKHLGDGEDDWRLVEATIFEKTGKP